MQIKMKNKKAILMPEVLKIIIAALCIAALVYLAISVYGLTTKKTRIEQARATLDQIEAKIKSLNASAENSASMIIMSPSEWYIVSFLPSSVERPRLCGPICLCICEDYDIDGCNSGGLCRNLVKAVYLPSGESYIEIDKSFNLEITKLPDGWAIKKGA